MCPCVPEARRVSQSEVMHYGRMHEKALALLCLPVIIGGSCCVRCASAVVIPHVGRRRKYRGAWARAVGAGL